MDVPERSLTSLPVTYKCERALHFLSVIAFLSIAYLGQVVWIPILISGFIALFSAPAVNFLMQLRLSKSIASLVVVILLSVMFVYLCSILIEPSIRWLEAAPNIGNRLIDEIEKFGAQPSLANGEAVGQAMSSTLFSAVSALAQISFVLLMQIAAIVIMTYFFLAYGEQLMRNIVKVQDSFSEKKLTVVIFNAIRNDVTTYVLIVSLINIGLGVAFAITLKIIDFEDVVLWGTLAAVLNFAPYIGPLILVVILTLVGFAEGGKDMHDILLAPGLFFILNLIEGQFLTPTLLGKRFNMNPLLVVLWMTLWGWLWGVAGVLLAIPMLMCFKIISIHLNLIGDWVEILNCDAQECGNCKLVKKRSLFAIFTKKPVSEI